MHKSNLFYEANTELFGFDSLDAQTSLKKQRVPRRNRPKDLGDPGPATERALGGLKIRVSREKVGFLSNKRKLFLATTGWLLLVSFSYFNQLMY